MLGISVQPLDKGQRQVTNGPVAPILLSACSYAALGGVPSPPPSGTVARSLTVMLEGLADPHVAEREFTAHLQGYEREGGATAVKLPGADPAYYLNTGVMLALKALRGGG